MIATLYQGTSCRIINNGHFSDSFNISRGLKQGDPCSSYLFLCVIEIFAIELRNNPDIEAISTGSVKKLLGQYASDIWTVTKFTDKSFTAITQTFDRFYKSVGLKVNYNKTEVMRLGSLKNTEAKLYSQMQIKWSSGPVKILGIMFPDDDQVIKIWHRKSKINSVFGHPGV